MRAALIGFGSIAEHGHLPALQSLPDLEIAAISDLAAERRRDAAALAPGARLFASGFELLAAAPLDLIVICTPPSDHADLILEACKRGVGTIVSEKPFVLGEAEYDKVAAARAKADARVISVNNWMYSELNRRVMAMLREGIIGDVRLVELETERLAPARGHDSWVPDWRTNPAYGGGGILLDHGWHQMYLVLNWVRATLETISAKTRTVDHRNYPVEDEATIEMGFPEATGRIELKWTGSQRRNAGRIVGTDGVIEIFDDRLAVSGAQEFVVDFDHRLTESSYHPDWFRSMYIDSVVTVERAEADRNFREAGVLVSAVSEAYRSTAEGGRPVPVRCFAKV